MRHYLAKMLRRWAQSLDPQPTRMVLLTPEATSATNTVSKTYAWTEV